jgi:hypothetical protein
MSTTTEVDQYLVGLGRDRRGRAYEPSGLILEVVPESIESMIGVDEVESVRFSV